MTSACVVKPCHNEIAHQTTEVAVIIAVYNGADSIAAAIDSVLAQTDCQTEIIVVDDGSTDETPAIVQSFGDRVKLIRQTNAGVGAARNRGVRESTSPWIAFLDADDFWAPEKLRCQLERAASADSACAPPEIVYTNATNYGTIERVDELRHAPDQMPEGDVFDQLLEDNFLTLSGTMVSRRAFNEVGGFRENRDGAEDWDLWLRLSAQGARFAACPTPLCHYRWSSTSLSSNHRWNKRSRVKVLTRALQTDTARNRLSRLKRRRAMARTLSTSAWFVEPQSSRLATLWYLQALAHWPFDRTIWRSLARAVLRPRHC